MDGKALEFVILTDTHFLPRGGTMYGMDPRARLDAAIEVINRDHPDLEFVVILGDLADNGERAAYENLADSVSKLAAPLVLMMGNHDRRGAFRESFPKADDDGTGFIQALRVLPQASILTLDTLDEDGNTHVGILCPKRLEFLERSLHEAPKDRPLLLLQHHHSGKVGLRSMDHYNVRNAEEQWAVFQRAGRKPDYMFHGHIHRPIFGLWHGIPYHIQRGVNHQVGFDLDTDDKIPGSLEGPDYALVRVSTDTIAVHHRQFLYEGPSYWLHDADAVSGRFPA
ncbi:phosphodiesterase [Peteryoungia ipomoeae]|uniref:Phosphodiesterase n=1 Tax=Peteryoungia ipomoeae TaxID=1210932 RepID=A0A4S8NXP3_9HYPH|nr:phosphodiesterase [Peteryoungia ipomoeae]THV19859.1 phosphodiesterase [Peteryoungia ipomoeae]